MDLAGFFSPEERRKYFREQFLPGLIIKLFCHFTVPPKEKRLLIVSVSPHPLFFVINSERNEYKQKRPRLFEQQVLLRKSDYDFLDHDSFVDCSKVRDDFSQLEIENMISNDLTRILGVVNSDSVADILTVVDDSVTLEPRQKNRIISDLN